MPRKVLKKNTNIKKWGNKLRPQNYNSKCMEKRSRYYRIEKQIFRTWELPSNRSNRKPRGKTQNANRKLNCTYRYSKSKHKDMFFFFFSESHFSLDLIDDKSSISSFHSLLLKSINDCTGIQGCPWKLFLWKVSI